MNAIRALSLTACLAGALILPGQRPAYGFVGPSADGTATPDGGTIEVGGHEGGHGSGGPSVYTSCILRDTDNYLLDVTDTLVDGGVPPVYSGGKGMAACVRRDNGTTDVFPISPRDAAALVADMAVSQLVLPTPDVATSPPRGGLTLVGVPVWFWTTNTAPVSTTATIPGLSATLTATLDSTTVTVDDTTTTCHHGGTPYDPTHPNATGSGGLACAHTFQTHGARTATITTRWRLTWTATNGQSGTLVDRTRPTTVTLNPHQAQATTD